MRRELLVAALFLSTFVLGSGAFAALDQSQELQNGSIALYDGIGLAQTFTAGITGTLTRVEIGFDPLAYPTTVEIRQTVAGFPVGTPLGTVYVNSGFGSGWINVDFSSLDILIFAGTQYAIVVSNNDPNSTSEVNVQHDPASYLGGEAWIYTGTAWEALASPGDLQFRTYAVPVPSALLLGVLGAGLVGRFRKSRTR